MVPSLLPAGPSYHYHRCLIAVIMKPDVAVGTMDASIKSMKSMRLYDRVERVLKELEAAGFAPDQPLTVQDLSPFDHMHYCGTAAVDQAIADCCIKPGQKVVEIGSGVGGPARWIAATTGADVTALETYLPRRRPPLACPITAYGGSDDALTPREHLDAWRSETTGAFRVRVFAGGHFYIEPRRAELLADITAMLAPVLARSDA